MVLLGLDRLIRSPSSRRRTTIYDGAMDRRLLSAEPIAAGRTAEVFGFESDKVVKLLRPGFKRAMIASEEGRTAAVHAAGAPAPNVHGTVEVSGRLGLVMDRVDGDLLLDEAASEPLRMAHWAHVLADAHASILSVSSDDLPKITDILEEKIAAADITRDHRSKALSVLAAAPEDDAVLHGDFHPGNVVLTEGEPMVIDWNDAARGAASADVARTMWLLSPATIPESTPNRRVATTMQNLFRRSYVKRLLRKTRIDRRVVDAWRLPVVAARLAEGVVAEDVALHAEVRRLTGG